MRTIGSSCRRGISSILGTIIFVSIIFTAFIPMLLVMKQADTLHEMRIFELERFDDEREGEDLHVYVFPTSGESDDLTLRVENRGDFMVKIVKIWINDNSYPEENFTIQPMGANQKTLAGYFTPEPSEYYFIKVTSDRGNIFSSDSGSLYFDSEGEWDGGMFMINVLLSYPSAGWFDIEISYEGNPLYTEPIHKSSSGPVFEFYTVTLPGTYSVKITRRDMEIIYDDSVEIEWPLGPPVVWVFA